MGTFGCFEVTIGYFGKERVDYLTYDTKGIWRCYEIKVSKSDFYRGRKPTFVGHYNYYVLTKELYEQVKDDIPKGVGVYVGTMSVKRASKRDLEVDEQILKDSMIRSLFREFEKKMQNDNPDIVANLKRRLRQVEKAKWDLRQSNTEMMNALFNKYGRNWREELFSEHARNRQSIT